MYKDINSLHNNDIQSVLFYFFFFCMEDENRETEELLSQARKR